MIKAKKRELKNVDNDIFSEVSKDVTGENKELYSAEEAAEIIARICHVKGNVIEEKIKLTEEELREEEVFKEFGF